MNINRRLLVFLHRHSILSPFSIETLLIFQKPLFSRNIIAAESIEEFNRQNGINRDEDHQHHDQYRDTETRSNVDKEGQSHHHSHHRSICCSKYSERRFVGSLPVSIAES